MSHDSDRVLGCSLLLLLALAIFIAGVAVLLNAGRHTRNKLIERYAAAVDTWKETTRSAFTDAIFVVEVSSSSFDAIQLEPTRITESEPKDSDLPAYKPLRYEGRLHYNHSSWTERPLHFTLHSRVTESGRNCVSEPLRGAEGIRFGYHEVHDWSHDPPRACASRQGGSFDTARRVCVTYMALRELCVKVSRSAENSCWKLDASGGGYGCAPRADGLWSLGTYRRVRAEQQRPPGDGESYHMRAATPDMTRPEYAPLIRVRHAAEPYIVAANLTSGTLSFGASDTVKATGGLEAIICGLALAAPALIFFMNRAFPSRRNTGCCCCVDEAFAEPEERARVLPYPSEYDGFEMIDAEAKEAGLIRAINGQQARRYAMEGPSGAVVVTRWTRARRWRV